MVHAQHASRADLVTPIITPRLIMVSPSTALRAQAALCAAFWMGMTAFPAKLTSAYALDFFDCPKAGRGAAPCSVTNQK